MADRSTEIQITNSLGALVNPATADNQEAELLILEPKTVRIATSGGFTYIGKAEAGASEAEAVWQVSRLDEASGLTVLFANGSTAYNAIWDNYLTLSYS